MDENLVRSAAENLKAFAVQQPVVAGHPLFEVAMAQLEEALGGKLITDTLAESPLEVVGP